MKEAAAWLKEGIKRSDASNQSVGIKVSSQATIQDIDSLKTTKR
ncbi:hypothetical protein [Wolbachia endosymbiont of Litomosoides sigmodontis]|nr:hypothetical protein [Wolbachia endosymbiont of Litomosoides sigmodontis]